MSKKVSPTLVGTFIVVGLALAVGTILLISSASFLSHSKQCILYFDATLTGLDSGAPVKFRGVTVGYVKDVLLHYNQATNDPSLPVLIELSGEIQMKRSDNGFNLMDETRLQEYVKRGLRAKLDTQSLLTGLLYVNLEFFPGTPLVYRQQEPVYTEIPTAPVDVQLLRMDVSAISQRISTVLDRLDARLGELSVKEVNQGLTNLLHSVNTLVHHPGITNSLTSLQVTLEEIRTLSTKLRSRIDTLGNTAELTLTESRQTLGEVRGGVQDVRELLAPQAPLRRELSDALEQLGEASRSVGALAEYLRQNPNAVLSGRKDRELKP